MEWPVIAALASVVVAGCTVLGFWLNLSERISRARAKADQAEAKATDAVRKCDDHTAALAAVSASFSLYREQVAREYIHREVMKEVEERLTQAIDRLGDRLDRFLEPHQGGHGRRGN